MAVTGHRFLSNGNSSTMLLRVARNQDRVPNMLPSGTSAEHYVVA